MVDVVIKMMPITKNKTALVFLNVNYTSTLRISMKREHL